MSKLRILVAEDEKHLRDILRIQLETAGYEVIDAPDGERALARAAEEVPDLILLDVMMPHLDGFEVCRRLRQGFATRNIPIIYLTAKDQPGDKLQGLQGGANDYITKPWKAQELMLRVQNSLNWSRQQRSASPLTGLPGNVSINEELTRRLESGQPFAILQIDIDYFKAFNDHYGYSRGDQAIRTVAQIITETSMRNGGDTNFVGHIGGDDFLIISSVDHADDLGEEIISEFNQAVTRLYDAVDLEAGFVEVRNRLHNIERFPLMSLTIAMVSTDRMPVNHLAQLTDIAQELKAHGKGIPGSVLVGERRRQPGVPGANRHVA